MNVNDDARVLDLALETLAELITGSSINGDKVLVACRKAWEEASDGSALSDRVRDAVKDAALALARVEVLDEGLWERNDWRTVCDEVARQLEATGEVDAAWLTAHLYLGFEGQPRAVLHALPGNRRMKPKTRKGKGKGKKNRDWRRL